MLKELVIALSLANICFISAWRQLLIPSSFSFYYHQKTMPAQGEYVALVLDVLLLAALFFFGITQARRLRSVKARRWAKVLFILILGVPLFGLLAQLNHDDVSEFIQPLVGDEAAARRLLTTIILTGWFAVLLVALFRISKAVRVALALIQILAPLVLITFTQAAVFAMRYRPGGEGRAAPPVVRQGARGQRMLWLVFDELDFRMAFPKRPPTVELGELDRLASRSLFAGNAYPPARATVMAIPSLITGRLVSEARRTGPDELMLKFGDDTEPVPWSAQPNIFSRAHEEGFNTALVGWFHPYCRIIGSSLTKCVWEENPLSFRLARQATPGSPPTGAQGVASYMYDYVREVALTYPPVALIAPRGPDTQELLRRQRVSGFRNIHREAIAAATDPSLDVVMIHWPIPHDPNIYDRSQDKISDGPGHSYLDNLELVDRTLGDVRRAMESNGTWDSTVVLVTSDHWWRAGSLWKKRLTLTAEDEAAWGGVEDHRIPFILKMAGAGREGVNFAAPFNTVLTHDLLLAILHGEVSDTKGAAAWLDRHRSIGRSPYDERLLN
jgi:hypothetical protein